MSTSNTRNVLKDNESIDNYYDKYSRLFMVFMLVLVSLIMCVEYFTNRLVCVIPKELTYQTDHINAACWSSGIFIYKEMTGKSSDNFYYGIPNKVKFDGRNAVNKLCSVHSDFTSDLNCKPMTKVYFTQHQWIPFYIGLLALVYYLPYPIFKMVNPDIISLNKIIEISSDDVAVVVIQNYFNYDVNPIYRLRLRVWLNILVKLIYVVINVFAFCFTGYLLNGNYENYGNKFLKGGNHSKMEVNINKNPGQILLPSRGLCEIRDGINDYNENNTFRCEVPSNILYQYALFVLWNLFVIGITVSVVGLVANISGHLTRFLCFGKTVTVRRIFRYMTLREAEYLILIKRKNMLLYGDVLRRLKDGSTNEDGKFIETCSLVSTV